MKSRKIIDFSKKVMMLVGINPTVFKGKVNGFLGRNVITNYFDTKYEKKALISYIIVPFQNHQNDNVHQNFWQAREMARIVSNKGYDVDIIPYYDPYVHLKKKYDLVIAQFPKDVDCFSNNIKENAIKIAYLTTSSPEFNNAAELSRIDQMEKRRGVRLEPLRQIPELTDDFYSYDAFFVMGNETTLSTYKGINKNCFLIKNHTNAIDCSIDVNKKKSNNFMFIGSVGQVHKGLDILLEIFSEEGFPCNLYVLGAYKNEREFYEFYDIELNYTKNIFSEGFVDISSSKFKELSEKCSYMIMPSCSEGMAGSVLDAMAGGVIPIVSKNCGYDEEDGAVILDNCDAETIRSFIISYSKKPLDWIIEKCQKEVEIARVKYSREQYTKSLEEAFDFLKL
ncbi:glycosyltransferase [Butyrivibrio sp. INlla18]|uniref:glycosyltransferase n=1 Tax=Butyrivibrio sp. INlla18 TaxID=1520806 RepID=UPI000B88D211|nr:glycosyltransferase [Butyrivibrio sp. INlla18]